MHAGSTSIPSIRLSQYHRHTSGTPQRNGEHATANNDLHAPLVKNEFYDELRAASVSLSSWQLPARQRSPLLTQCLTRRDKAEDLAVLIQPGPPVPTISQCILQFLAALQQARQAARQNRPRALNTNGSKKSNSGGNGLRVPEPALPMKMSYVKESMRATRARRLLWLTRSCPRNVMGQGSNDRRKALM